MPIDFTLEEIRVINVAMNIADDPEQMAEAVGVTKEEVLEIMDSIDQKLADN